MGNEVWAEVRGNAYWDGIKEAVKLMLPFLAGFGIQKWITQYATPLMWTGAFVIALAIAYWDRFPKRGHRTATRRVADTPANRIASEVFSKLSALQKTSIKLVYDHSRLTDLSGKLRALGVPGPRADSITGYIVSTNLVKKDFAGAIEPNPAVAPVVEAMLHEAPSEDIVKSIVSEITEVMTTSLKAEHQSEMEHVIRKLEGDRIKAVQDAISRNGSPSLGVVQDLETAKYLTIQSAIYEPSSTANYKNKIRVVITNDSGKDVEIWSPIWESTEVQCQYPLGTSLQMEGQKGWRHGDWGEKFYV